jgi:hypothetical protein
MSMKFLERFDQPSRYFLLLHGRAETTELKKLIWIFHSWPLRFPSILHRLDRSGTFLTGSLKSVQCVMHQFSINSMSFIQIFSECGNIVRKVMLASPDRLYWSLLSFTLLLGL